MVLRNSGNDNQSTHQTPPRPPITEFGPTKSYGSYFANGTFTLMRDAMMQRLVRETDLDTQAYRPAVVYINGEYWGLYNLREKVNEDYIISHHEMAPGNTDLIEGYGTVNAGTGTVNNQMRNYMANPRACGVEQLHICGGELSRDRQLHRLSPRRHLLSKLRHRQHQDLASAPAARPVSLGGLRPGLRLRPLARAIYVPAMARDYGDYDNMFKFYTAGTGTGSSWPNEAAARLVAPQPARRTRSSRNSSSVAAPTS